MDEVQRTSERPIDMVFISALPPFALLSARTLNKRLHAQILHAQMIVGLWGFSSNAKGTDDRLGKAFTDPVVTTLAEALAYAEREPDPETSQPLNDEMAAEHLQTNLP